MIRKIFVLFSSCILLILFVFPATSAQAAVFVISEIMYDPIKNGDGDKVEWIELYAANDMALSLKSNGQIVDFYLCAKKTCSSAYAVYATEKDLPIRRGELLIFTKDPEIFQKTYPALDDVKIIKTSSSFNLLENADAFVAYSLDNKNSWFENITYSEFFDQKKEGFSLEKINLEKENAQNNWRESFCQGGTPGKENSKKEDCEKDESGEDKASPYAEKVIINEIYPAPVTKAGEEEFVEIKNLTDEDLDFSDWTITDSKKIASKISKIVSGNIFSVFYGSFSLNNDKNGDEVFLYDESKKLVSSKKYTDAKSGKSYSFDNSAWRWTSKPTPGKENQLDKILSGKIKQDENIYARVYANFEAKSDRDAKKFTWNFGDGHKSYLKKTKHKYEKSGRYEASLKITGNGEDTLINFDVKVRDYPSPKIKIVGLVPNPIGKDSENEWIEIKNNTKKKINLKGWSIATGWEKMTNHPIREKFEIKPGKTKKITRKLSAFSLGNTKTKIELRYPNGKAADQVKYDRKTGKIEEDALYEKVDNQWTWTEPQNDTESKNSIPLSNETPDQEKTPAKTEEIIISGINYSGNPLIQTKKENRVQLISLSKNIKTPVALLENQTPRVLGKETVRKEYKHWFSIFLDNTNSLLNRLLNKIF